MKVVADQVMSSLAADALQASPAASEAFPPVPPESSPSDRSSPEAVESAPQRKPARKHHAKASQRHD